MDLQAVTLHGFRRFAKQTELRTNGKLVALLGPNEAGKTSILKAISLIGNSAAIPKSDLSRATPVNDEQVVISARFKLESDDLIAANLERPTWYVLDKQASGKQSHRFEPRVKQREISGRAKISGVLQKVRSNNKLWGRLLQKHAEAAELFDAAIEILASPDETLDEANFQKIRDVRTFLDEKIEQGDPLYARALSNSIFDLLTNESALTPEKVAYDVIFKRIPKILFFSNDDRLLKGSYPLEELAGDLPSALVNIAKVASLNLKEFIKYIEDEDAPNIARLKTQANDELRSKFDESWSQSGVHVAFEVLGQEIQVLIREEDYNFTKLAERSDGLRQFVALQAFTTCERVENPVLLIDEAEMRLHYDAQADLIQMLSRQTVSSKIIYTTHSAGCLPEDLGNGVRLVDYERGEHGPASSVVRNHFWSRSEGGLEPLLFGMGAATLAFFPIRRALLTEGESDMLLLPSMFRECFDSVALSFQVVPGLSKTSGINLPILARNGKGVAFSLDFDEGGRDLEKKIIGAGFSEKAVFFLRGSKGTDFQLEDFINPKLLALGASEAMSELGNKHAAMTPSSFKATGRLKTISSHFQLNKAGDVPKTLVAYKILEEIIRAPDVPLIDPQKRRAFEAYARDVRAYLSA